MSKIYIIILYWLHRQKRIKFLFNTRHKRNVYSECVIHKVDYVYYVQPGKQNFKLIDGNNDGKVSSDEFSKYSLHSYCPYGTVTSGKNWLI